MAAQAQNSADIPRKQRIRDSLIAAGLLALTVAVVWRAFYPGLGSFDSGQIVLEAQKDQALDWWTPFGVTVLRGWFALGLGLSSAWLAQVLLFTGGSFAVARLFVTAPWAAAATFVIVLWPPTLGQLATISRDVFSAGFSLLAIAALGMTLRSEPFQGRWWGWLTGAFMLALLAYLTRQNMIVIAMSGAGAVAVAATAGRERFTRTRVRLATVIGAALVTAVVAVGIGAVFNKVTETEAVHAERATWVYDLLAMSQRTDENLFPDELRRTYELGRTSPRPNADALARFGWIDVTSVYTEKEPLGFWDDEIAARETPILRSGWLDAIRDHPLDYVYVRGRFVTALAGLHNHRTDSYMGIEVQRIAYPQIAHPRSFERTRDYLGVFVGPGATLPLELGWLYLLPATALVAFLWRRRAPDRLLALSIASAIWLNLAVLFFVAPAVTYRYIGFMAPFTLLLGLWALSIGPLQRFASNSARMT